MRRSLVWLGLLAETILAAPASGPLSPEELRGRQIYLRGTSASQKEIVALLDNGRTPVPATIMPCGNCHGADGRGKPEGGVVPPDITWDALTKPYGVYQPNGRSHPPYTESTLKRAFTMGMDSGGNRLDPVMPRFQLSYEDAACLVAFLKRLGRLTDPGLSDTSISIGVVLPPVDRLAPMNRLVRDALTAYFERFNRDGGVYGRGIELAFRDLPPKGAERAAAFRSWLEHEPVFALTGVYLAEAESELAPILNEAETPSICAFAPEPDLRQPLNRFVFYLTAGLRGEVDQIADLVRKRGPAGGRAVIARAPQTQAVARDAAAALREAGWKVDEMPSEALGCEGAARVVWLSPASPDAMLRKCAQSADKSTEYFIPGTLAGRDLLDLPAVLDGRVFVTMASGDWQAASDPAAAALASAHLLTLALQRSGRNLTRQALVDTLEGVYKADLGNTVVSYGPNRRTGSSAAAYVVDLRAHRLVAVPGKR
jgi:ABC-type branched-subunit amino acid transport system substrate-binding protein